MKKLFEELKFLTGYNSHGYWSTLRETFETEVELDNEPFICLTSEEIEPYDDLRTIWVCPEAILAFRYACSASDFELSREALMTKYPDWEQEVETIDLTNRLFLKDSDDGDHGFLAVERPFSL